MGHAKLSPSSSNRWLNCPGSVAAIAALPEKDDSNIYADEGTFAHEIAERAINAVIASSTDATVGEVLTGLMCTVSECERFIATGEMVDFLEDYVDFCIECYDNGQKHYVESRVYATREVYGTADFMAVVGNVLEVVDLKYGAGIPVSPVGNTQARIYALGALELIRTTDAVLIDKIDTVRIRIFQPRNKAGGGVEELSVAELDAWRRGVLHNGVNAAKADNAPRVAGSHCQFCPVAGVCHARKDAALEGAKHVFADTETLGVKGTAPDPKDLTVEEIGKVLTAAPLVESWLKGVRAYADELTLGGMAIEGFKRVRKVGKRKWADEKRAEAMLREMLPDGVPPTADPKLLSPAQAEKKLDIIGKALVYELTTKPDAGTALVPESDKRPAFSPGDVFNKIEEEEKK